LTLSFKFLADLNISPVTVEALQRQGWDIVRVSTHLPAWAPDEEILDFARHGGYVLVTQDLDFSALLALRGWNEPSLITLRLLDSEPGLVARKLLEASDLLEELLPQGCAVTVKDETVRVRMLPIR
jgi:predicted nuclease of predicted toxin-antitoxin system